MILLKLLAPTFVLMIALLQVGFASRWRDRRTRRHELVLKLLVSIMILGTFVTSWIVIADHRESKKNAMLFRELREVAAQEAQAATKREQAAIDRNQALEAKLGSLQQTLDPFVALASRQYPAVSVDAALAKLADDVRRQYEQLETIRDYTETAKLNFVGTSGMAVPPLVERTAISRMLEGAVIITESRSSYMCDPASIQKYATVSAQSSRFPFAYYALAFCLSQSGDGSWKHYAVRAVEILRRTTTIDGHHPNHDQALRELEEALRQ